MAKNKRPCVAQPCHAHKRSTHRDYDKNGRSIWMPIEEKSLSRRLLSAIIYTEGLIYFLISGRLLQIPPLNASRNRTCLKTPALTLTFRSYGRSRRQHGCSVRGAVPSHHLTDRREGARARARASMRQERVDSGDVVRMLARPLQESKANHACRTALSAIVDRE